MGVQVSDHHPDCFFLTDQDDEAAKSCHTMTVGLSTVFLLRVTSLTPNRLGRHAGGRRWSGRVTSLTVDYLARSRVMHMTPLTGSA